MSNFLPKGYESLKSPKSYWKMSEMKEGDNRLRIVKQPIAGWLEWDDKKPVRYQPDQKPKKAIDLDNPPKAFWACYVWDYAREGLFILEITQSSILKALTLFAEDEDWGDFTKYDLKFNKVGSGKDTRYALTPMPHKPLQPKVEDAIKSSPVRLEALYYGGDPWTDLDASIDEVSGEVLQGECQNPLETLKESLELDNIPTERLQEYLTELANIKGKSVDEIISSALMTQLLPKFKGTFSKFLAKGNEELKAI